MITAYIISKDRACQLHALLDSIQTNMPFTFSKIFVQYTYSNERFRDAYFKLQKANLHPNVVWSFEDDRRLDFIDCMKFAENPLFCIFTDDSIVYRHVLSKRGPREVIYHHFNADPQLLCFSLRYGRNTIVQDYKTGRLQRPFDNLFGNDIYSMPGDDVCKWDWTTHYPSENFGYIIGMDGHIYRTNELLEITEQLEFETFRSWEGVLAGDWRHKFLDRPHIASYGLSTVVNIPTNNVQIPPIPHGEKFPISIEVLNDYYLRGQVINWKAMDFSNIVGSHQEIELVIGEK